MLGFDVRKLVFEIINFLVLMVILRFILFKPLMKILKERQDKIRAGLETAETADVKLSDAQSEADRFLVEARDEGDRLKEEIRKAAEDEKSRMLSDARKKAEQIVHETQARVEEEREKTIAELRSRLMELVTLTTRKILQEELSLAEQRTLVERAVATSLRELETEGSSVFSTGKEA